MPIEPILDEVELLHAIGAPLKGLAEQHTRATEELMTIAGSVRNTATSLAVLVATKLRGGDDLRIAETPAKFEKQICFIPRARYRDLAVSGHTESIALLRAHLVLSSFLTATSKGGNRAQGSSNRR